MYDSMDGGRDPTVDQLQETDELLQHSTSSRLSVRHIASIQVRNFTPFPARDTLTSTLLQKPNVSLQSGTMDDTEILLARRRSRKISSSSVRTLRSIHNTNVHDETLDFGDTDVTPRLRQRTVSRASASATPITLGGSHRTSNMMPASSTPTMRRTRPRTSSHSSMLDTPMRQLTPTADDIPIPVPTTSYIFDSLASQRELEGVIWSRLMPTFLTISEPDDLRDAPVAGPSSFGHSRNNSGTRDGGIQARRPVGEPSSTDSSGLGRGSPTTLKTMGPRRTASQTKRNSSSETPARISNGSVTLPSPRDITFPRSPPPTPPGSTGGPITPMYLSSFHRPSTNPKFDIAPDDGIGMNRSHLVADRISVQLWGCPGSQWGQNDEKGKGKERELNPPSVLDEESWKELINWDLHLTQLVPLSEEFKTTPTKLPANTLTITFNPYGETFYLPTGFFDTPREHARSRSPEYNSDSEVNARHVRKPIPSHFLVSERGRRRNTRGDLESSSFQDLVKLASLQAVITDTQTSLHELVRSCDQLIEGDKVGVLRREVSEKEFRLRFLLEQRGLLDDCINASHEELLSRKETLEKRRRLLAEARALHEEDLLSEFERGTRMANERQRLAKLRSQIIPIRTSLLSTLAFMFPIELLSPPDLLFTILSVPLPIPLAGTDPAPPLTMASCADVSEDGVATALGYAALLIHLTASYLNHLLTYPITYIGSRSLIKDPISTMVGPRMFPLYSKGVDTYRFEYAVFLLNKDIEMLMMDRDLRALDMRQTLPNLKNLLLTLTNGEEHIPSKQRPLPSPSISSGLQSPSLQSEQAASPPPLTSELSTEANADGSETTPGSTPKLTSSALPSVTLTDDDKQKLTVVTGTNSTTSSSRVTNIARRPKSYLGFAPLTSMFRRTPSTRTASDATQAAGVAGVALESDAVSDASTPSDSDLSESSSAETSQGTSTEAEADDEEEDDRRTIRGVSAANSTPVTPVDAVGPRLGLGKALQLGKAAKEEKHGEDGGDSANVDVETVTIVLQT